MEMEEVMENLAAGAKALMSQQVGREITEDEVRQIKLVRDEVSEGVIKLTIVLDGVGERVRQGSMSETIGEVFRAGVRERARLEGLATPVLIEGWL